MQNQRQFLLGIFFIVALSVLAFYTLFLTDTHFFSDPILETVYFEDAYELREGNPVMVLGHKIGRVKSIDFDVNAPPEKRIKVVLSLDKEVELLSNAEVSIKESTLLGGRHVNIYPGEFGGPPLERDPDGALYGSVEPNPIAALGELGNLFTDNRDKVASILTDLETIVANVRDGQGTVGKLLVDEVMAQDLAATVESLKNVTGQIDAGEGLLGALVRDPELVADVQAAADGLRTIADDIRAGEGMVGRLIYDEALADEFRAAVEAFSSVGQRIERGDGVAGKLLADEELGERVEEILLSFHQASTDIQAIAGQVRAGEGSVGKLLMEQELYDEALAAVGLLTRSLEDYREAAPITTFTSVLFSGF